MKTRTVAASDQALAVIRTMTFEPHGSGWLGVLNCGQMERGLYEDVNKALAALRGKWTRKLGGHLFPEDPRPQIAELLGNGHMQVAKDGHFPTPPAVVARMIEKAKLRSHHVVLEPSAGEGHIADAVRPLVAAVHVIELNGTRRSYLEAKGYTVVGTDFLAFAGGYDRILMNPPFEDGQDIAHVTHAFGCLRLGGIVVAIMSEGAFFRNDKKAVAFRERLLHHGESHLLPPDSFKPSGTSVATRLVVLKRN